MHMMGKSTTASFLFWAKSFIVIEGYSFKTFLKPFEKNQTLQSKKRTHILYMVMKVPIFPKACILKKLHLSVDSLSLSLMDCP